MNELTLQRTLTRRTKELTAWQAGAVGLVVLASLHSAATTAVLLEARERLDNQAARLQQAEQTRDAAIEQLGAVVLQAKADEQARAEQAAAYEAAGVYQYIGECVITSYCPCEECCGPWVDGLTATGIPAGPGVVAVDPDVIPLGSTVIVDGQRYLAADTGVRGLAVDICAAGHQEAAEYGVQMQEVWVVTS
ncbi:MAG: 3D domain-containing protein [Oscillospiraceae bacterium]|nr:3D domain-containing protein [Oscillospiraceae bacterium]